MENSTEECPNLNVSLEEEDGVAYISQEVSTNESCSSQISVHVQATTGSNFYFDVNTSNTVEDLKKLVAKRLKVPKTKICLLYQDRQLDHGTLDNYGIQDGSRITLLPNVETGLINQAPELSIMQVLDSLSDTQVNDFLCGKAPLNLTMRLGEHMMFIQLQLSCLSSKDRPASQAAQNVDQQQTPSIIQACKNLQRAVHRLSSDISAEREKGNRHEHIFSGTFSRVLNPILQDTRGRPQRDISTIVHILNDLLCAVPDVLGDTKETEKDSASTVTMVDEDSSLLSETTAQIEDSQAMTSKIEEECEENMVTRNKLDHLRFILDKRREKRKRRKQKPYSVSAQGTSDTVSV